MHCISNSVMYVLSVLSMGYSLGGMGFELLQEHKIFLLFEASRRTVRSTLWEVKEWGCEVTTHLRLVSWLSVTGTVLPLYDMQRDNFCFCLL
jgi:hypothetical protein